MSWVVIILVAGFTLPAANGEQTIFSILLKPSDDPADPSPQEYFDEMQMYFADEGASGGLFGPDSGFSMLSQVDRSQDLADGLKALQECDLDPFWEKGEIVTDLNECPYSMVKLLVYSMVPAVSLTFGMLGLWSRQRNVQGRGKETQIGSLVALGLALLSASYDWFFSWVLFRSPQGKYQTNVSEVGLAHLVATVALNFLMVHFWFRRKFLVGMPWYEYHKHSIGLHLVTAIMYLQPQAVMLLTSRLFNYDLFNVHFGTPSKMNEVLSNIGCLSLLIDIPQFALQMSVWMADTSGREAPKVSRVSMGLICISIALILKRQYVATVERQWYKEIVKMAGVRRLTTYGGSSRWLKFQKRGSATQQAAKGGSTSQQQLFLAWMQSMGRRQESIFQDGEDGQRQSLTDGDASEDSEDDLDSLSDSEQENDDEGEKGDGSGSGDDSDSEGSGSSEEDSSEDDSDSEGEESEEGSENDNVELQAYGRKRGRRRRRPADEEAPLGRRRADGSSVVSSSVGGLLGFARDIAGDTSSAGGVTAGGSESDIFAFARNVAGHMESDSGVVTESSQGFGLSGRKKRRRGKRRSRDDAFADADVFSDTGGSAVDPDDPILQFARNVADDISGAGSSTDGGSDIFGFARQVAQGASDSGIGGTVVSNESQDIWAFAREAARGVSETGAQSSAGASESDIFAFARQVAGKAAEGDASSVDGSDIFAFARRAADGASQSGIGTDASGSDIFAFARAAADGVSRSGVGSDTGGRASRRRQRTSRDDDGSDIFAFAQDAADMVSGTSASGAGVSGVSDIFAAAQQAADEFSRSGAGATTSAVSGGMSDIFGFAQGVADDASGGSSRQGRRQPRRSAARDAVSEDGSDIFAAARRAADDMSGAGTSAIESDIFAAARNAAADVSQSGVGGQSAAGFTDIFARPGASSARGSLPRGRQQDTRSQISEQSAQSSDIFMAAQRAADAFSNSGVASASQAGQSRVGMSNIFAQVGGGQATGGGGSRRPSVASDARSQHSEGSESDIFAAARKAAGDASASGVASAAPARSVVGGMSDIFAPAGAKARSAPITSAAASARLEVQSQHSQDGSESDIFEAARKAAGDASASGVASAAPTRSVVGGMSDIFAPTKAAQQARDRPLGASARGVASGSSARGAAAVAEEEDVESDIFDAARKAAGDASASGVASAAPGRSVVAGMSDIFAPAGAAASAGSKARGAAATITPAGTQLTTRSQSQDTESDIFDAARRAAGDASVSGVASAAATRSVVGGMSDIFAQPGAAARGPAAARSAAAAAAHAGVELETESQQSEESDIFAAARAAAGDASASGVASAAGGRSSVVGMSEIFAVPGRPAPLQAKAGAPDRGSSLGQLPKAPTALPVQSAPRPVAKAASSRVQDDVSADGSGDFDLFNVARGAADQTSRSGVHSARAGNVMGDLFGGGARSSSARNRADQVSDAGSDIFGAARQAAADFSQSGVDSGSDIFGAALGAAGDFSQSGVGSRVGSDGGASDLFASARRAAGAASDAGSFASRPGGTAAGQDLFAVGRRGAAQAAAPAQRRFMADTRHSSAPPSMPFEVPATQSSAPPLKLDQVKVVCPPEDPHVDQPPWAVVSLPRLLSPPPPPRQVPPSPPGAPPLDATLPPTGALTALPHPAATSQTRPPPLPTGAVSARRKDSAGVQSTTRADQRPLDGQEPSPDVAEAHLPEATQEVARSPQGAGQMLRFAREVAAAAAAPPSASGNSSAPSRTAVVAEIPPGSTPAGAPDLEGLFLRRQRGAGGPSATSPSNLQDMPPPPAAVAAPAQVAPAPPIGQPPSPRSLRRQCEAQRRGDGQRPQRPLPPSSQRPAPPSPPSTPAGERPAPEGWAASPKSAWTRRLRKAEEEKAQHFPLDTEEIRRENVNLAEHFQLDTVERDRAVGSQAPVASVTTAAAASGLAAVADAATTAPASIAASAAPPVATAMATKAAASPPSSSGSGTGQAADARQQRLHLRQERLRQGMVNDDRGYKRKQSRTALDLQKLDVSAVTPEDASPLSAAPQRSAGVRAEGSSPHEESNS